jgi:hypothetical protein
LVAGFLATKSEFNPGLWHQFPKGGVEGAKRATRFTSE